MEFGNHGKLPVKGSGDIQVRPGRKTHIMKEVLYVPGISVNLLSIAAVDRRGLHVSFGNKSVKIIHKTINHTVATGKAKNGLYKLTDCTAERVFLSHTTYLTTDLIVD